MTSSLARQNRRQLKRAQTALGAIPGAIPDVPQRNDLEILKKAIFEAHQLRDALEEARTVISYMAIDLNRLMHETDRQRAVTIRLAQIVSKGPEKGFVVGPDRKESFSIRDIQRIEDQLICEYEVACALTTLAETYYQGRGSE